MPVPTPEPDWLALLLDRLPAWAAGIGAAALGGWAAVSKLRRSISADDASTSAHTAWSEIINALRTDVAELRAEARANEEERDALRARVDVLERELHAANLRLVEAGLTQPGPL